MSEPSVLDRPAGLFDDEHVAYRDSVRTHFGRTAVPEYEAWSRDGGIPDDALRSAAEHGFVATGVPEAQGGLGLVDPRFSAILVEEAVRAGLLALALVLAAHGDVPVRALEASGADATPAWLERLGTAELRAATVLHASVRTREDGSLEGRAPAVVGGAAAGLFVVAVVDPAPQVVVVERTAPGVTVEPLEAPVGLGAAGFADLVLDGARGTVLKGVGVEELVTGERAAPRRRRRGGGPLGARHHRHVRRRPQGVRHADRPVREHEPAARRSRRRAAGRAGARRPGARRTRRRNPLVG